MNNARLTHILSGFAWAVGLGLVSIGYFLLSVAFSTSFFFNNGGPDFPALMVWGATWILVVQAAVVVFWTRPLLTFALIELCNYAAIVVFPDRTIVAGVTVLFGAFNVTLRCRRIVWSWAVAIGCALDIATEIATDVHGGVQVNAFVVLLTILRTAGFYIAPVLTGLLIESYRKSAEIAADRERLAREREDALVRGNDAMVSAAIAQERYRMAREIHDVSAHRLSGINLQANAALRLLHRGSGPAVEFIELIRDESERIVRSVNEIVAVLRRSDHETPPNVPPSLGRLDELIAPILRDFPNVDVQTQGDLADLSPTVSFACFRIIQESLSNARKHAPGAAVTVRVTRDQHAVMVEVKNDAPDQPAGRQAGMGGGFGIIGMTERAITLGGTFQSSPTADGGWRTVAVVPVGEGAV